MEQQDQQKEQQDQQKEQGQTVRKANLLHYENILKRIKQNPTIYSENFRKMIESLVVETTDDLFDHCGLFNN